MTEQGGPPSIDDPFFAAFHRRHPDADLVLLQPPSAPAEVVDPVELDDARRMVDAAVAAYTSLLPVLPPDLDGPALSWRQAPSGGWSFTVRKALRGVGGEEGREQLRRIAAELHGRGWAVAARDGSPVVVLRCSNGWLDLEARSGPAATTIVVATPPVAVREEDLVTLREEARSR